MPRPRRGSSAGERVPRVYGRAHRIVRGRAGAARPRAGGRGAQDSLRADPAAERPLQNRYGLKNRSAGCARPAQHQNVVRPLEALGYAVDVWDVTIEPPEGAVVDKTPYAAGKTPCAVDACVHESQRAGDDAIDALCARADCRVDAVGYRANPRLVRNLIRQFYAEHALARALGQAQTYDVAAAVSEDVAVLRPLARRRVGN